MWYNNQASGRLTQLGECLLDVEEVTGSSPVSSTSPNLKRTPFCENRFRFFLLFTVTAKYDIIKLLKQEHLGAGVGNVI